MITNNFVATLNTFNIPIGDKLFGAAPEKEWLNLIGYLEPPVVSNGQLSGATRWLHIFT